MQATTCSCMCACPARVTHTTPHNCHTRCAHDAQRGPALSAHVRCSARTQRPTRLSRQLGARRPQHTGSRWPAVARGA
eukprot:3379659-Prymnesium_polylepis.1